MEGFLSQWGLSLSLSHEGKLMGSWGLRYRVGLRVLREGYLVQGQARCPSHIGPGAGAAPWLGLLSSVTLL